MITFCLLARKKTAKKLNFWTRWFCALQTIAHLFPHPSFNAYCAPLLAFTPHHCFHVPDALAFLFPMVPRSQFPDNFFKRFCCPSRHCESASAYLIPHALTKSLSRSMHPFYTSPTLAARGSNLLDTLFSFRGPSSLLSFLDDVFCWFLSGSFSLFFTHSSICCAALDIRSPRRYNGHVPHLICCI